jgi:stearoyl-CoA desaturase (delta-9 desaturase)
MQIFGEGWHNNHHAHPVSARHGLAWYEVNVNWWGACALRLLGVAKDVQVVDAAGRAKEAASTRARP